MANKHSYSNKLFSCFKKALTYFLVVVLLIARKSFMHVWISNWAYLCQIYSIEPLQSRAVIRQLRLTALDILNFIFDVRRDYRITLALAAFKKQRLNQSAAPPADNALMPSSAFFKENSP